MRRASGRKWTRGKPKKPESFEDFSAGLPTRADVLKLMEAYHEREIKPWVEYTVAPWWKKLWWEIRDAWATTFSREEPDADV